MKITCLVKFVPDVDRFSYDYERNILIRENRELILNPDDGKALGLALQLKKKNPDIEVEVVTMGPLSVKEQMYDLIRRGADRGTLISDRRYAGSDTYATAGILAAYLKKSEWDLILSGSETLDGGTAHIPSQLAVCLDTELLCNIRSANTEELEEGRLSCDVLEGEELLTYEVCLPAVCGIARDAAFRLPFVRYFNLGKDVSDQLQILDNEALGLPDDRIGLRGSRTRVVSAYALEAEAPDTEQHVFGNVDDGVEYVAAFLAEKGFLNPSEEGRRL